MQESVAVDGLAIPAVQKRNSMLTVVLSSFIGNTIEYYDFLAYGLGAALVFSRLFFPTVSPLTAVLASFAIFGVASSRARWAASSSGISATPGAGRTP